MGSLGYEDVGAHGATGGEHVSVPVHDLGVHDVRVFKNTVQHIAHCGEVIEHQGGVGGERGHRSDTFSLRGEGVDRLTLELCREEEIDEDRYAADHDGEKPGQLALNRVQSAVAQDPGEGWPSRHEITHPGAAHR